MGRSPIRALAGSALLLLLAACADQAAAPDLESAGVRAPDAEADTLVPLVRRLASEKGITPLPAAPPVRPALARLGQALAFDRVLSGNRDIACMTCHLPAFATADGRSLSVGQGGAGVGPARSHPGGAFIGRNAPALFNLQAMSSYFWDGRVSKDGGGTFHSPAGADLSPEITAAFEFGGLSAQVLFPLLSRSEMRGDAGNELAAVPDDRPAEVWRAIWARLAAIPEYRGLFQAAYPGTRFEDMNIGHAANAVAGFLVKELTLTDTPWDRFLAGDDFALSAEQLRGARGFLAFSCARCHNGPALSDGGFHNVLVAQAGPGNGDGPDGHDDFGRMHVTGNPAERYAFRTPPLRNVELTAPYGHSGAYRELRDFVDHYSDPDAKIRTFDPSTLEPALQGTFRNTAEQLIAQRDPLMATNPLSERVVSDLTAFLRALTDERARTLRRLAPTRVPSGLPVD